MWVLVGLGVLFLIWLIRGFLSPAQFRDGALLLWASSHDRLLSLREGDDGYRELRRFPETKRGFRRNAAVYLGGPRSPLPSLKLMSPDGRIEATPGGGATLIVTGGGIERFEESKGWYEIEPGKHPIPGQVLLRRGDELVLEFRR